MIEAMWEATKTLCIIIVCGSLMAAAIFGLIVALFWAVECSIVFGILLGALYLWVALTAVFMWGMG
jgi:hypothetical protein